MEPTEILYSVRNQVATITLNRPDRLNAWTRQMEREIDDALDMAERDPEVRVIVLTGAGRGFCAGADMSLLSQIAESGANEEKLPEEDAFGDGWRKEVPRKYARLMGITKPIVAAINGPAVGLGFVIPLYCDIRVAARSARFSVIFSRRGLIAEYGMAWMLPRIVGLGRAADLMLTSRMIGAEEARQIGLVSQVLPDESFAANIQETAEDLAANVSPRSLRAMKRQLYEGQFQPFHQAYDMAMTEMAESLKSEDFREGVAHFVEKRKPRFTGR